MTFKDDRKRPGGKPAGGAQKKYSAAKGGKGDEKSGKPFRKAAPKPGFEKRPPKPAEGFATMAPERISKLLARAGVASRRDVERMIMEGRIRLNGEVLTAPAVNATYADNIEVDGERIRGPERTRLWLYHKPAGLVTTNADPEGRPTVFDNLPEGLPRVMSIGRLDINTEGLLLLTNDGGLARVLELPTTGWLRRYRVRAHGSVDQSKLDQLKDGIAVDGVLYGGIEAVLDREQGHNAWITMGLREGKNREIKNVLGALGLDVNRLIRISYGPFQLGNLPEGEVVEIRGRMLRDQLGPRLIEDANANFDAPIYDHKGELVVEEEDARPARAPRPASAPRERDNRFEDRKGGGDRGDRGDRRERALGKLSTKPGGKDDRTDKKILPRNARSANVWMAPGARPLGEKQAAAAARKAARPGRPAPADKPQATYNDRVAKPVVHKVKDDEGQWIRSSGNDEKPRRDREDGGRDRRDGPRSEGRSFGDRREGGRDERPRGDFAGRDAARPARAYSGKPKSDGYKSDGYKSDRPKSDRPKFDRPKTDRFKSDGAGSDRPFGDKPRGKPSGKPGGKPGGKPFGGKPGMNKSGGKPGGRPSGKPGGGRPGGKPGGGRGADRRG